MIIVDVVSIMRIFADENIASFRNGNFRRLEHLGVGVKRGGDNCNAENQFLTISSSVLHFTRAALSRLNPLLVRSIVKISSRYSKKNPRRTLLVRQPNKRKFSEKSLGIRIAQHTPEKTASAANKETRKRLTCKNEERIIGRQPQTSPPRLL